MGVGRTVVTILAAGIAALFAVTPAAAQDSPWWRGDRGLILGYGCTAIELEPVDPRFSCPSQASHVHEAMDFDLAYGTRIYAGRPGLVTAVGGSGSDRHDYGPNYVRIWLDEGDDVLLGHLSGAVVKAGDRVSVGTLIGYSGDLGATDVPNLDFSARPHGTTSYESIDPARFLSFLPAVSGRDGATYEAGWSAVAGRAWIRPATLHGDWTQLPGGPADGFRSQLLVGYDGAGHGLVFGAGVDGSLWENVEGDAPAPAGTWSGWRPVEPLPQIGLDAPLASGAGPDGRLWLTAMATDGSAWTAGQLTVAGPWSSWSRTTSDLRRPFTRRVVAHPGCRCS
jgi:Peptidase family M23